jgi:SsrA-binding protein
VSENGIKIITTNRKARHEYHIHDTLEAGLVLTGTEIKSIRAGHVSIQEAYVTHRNGEMWLVGMHIAPYEPADRENHDVLRPRKLLMHAREIARWADDVQQKGFTIVPLRIYLRRGRAKVEIALVRGKKLYDKRQTLAKKDSQRRMDRALSDHRKGRR